jgi:hypothetical protein
MDKNSLGLIIHKTLQQFYPNMRLPVSSYQIEDILDKARITKRNSNKQEISKIIKILKHHIEIAEQNKVKKVEPTEYKPIFMNMEADNGYLEKMREDLLDNLDKMNINNKIVSEETKIRKEINSTPFNTKVFDLNLIIENKFRNAQKYPSPSKYTVEFTNNQEDDNNIYYPNNLGNIEEIELIECMINDNSFNTNEYIILSVKELDSDILSNSKFVRKCFTRLISFNIIEINDKKYRVYDIPKDAIKKYNPPINLNSLSIHIKNANGEDLVFERDELGIEPLLNSFKFKLKMKKKDDYITLNSFTQ